ncbi:MAG: putative LPS assembly protein LptD [Saprospiraceae bacterium]
MNGNYNFAADSFQWSPIAVSGNTTFFKGLSNFNFRASYSPYVYDNNGKITKKTVWDNGKILPEFRNMTGGLFTSLSFSAVRQFLTGKKKDNNQKKIR